MLLGAGAEVDGAGDDGWTPRMLAVAGEHVAVVRMLLAAGGKVDLSDCEALEQRRAGEAMQGRLPQDPLQAA